MQREDEVTSSEQGWEEHKRSSKTTGQRRSGHRNKRYSNHASSRRRNRDPKGRVPGSEQPRGDTTKLEGYVLTLSIKVTMESLSASRSKVRRDAREGSLASISTSVRTASVLTRTSRLGCPRSLWANPFKVKEFGREGAIQKYEAHLRSSADLQQKLGQLSNKVLLCRCDLSEACHGDALIRAWEEKFLSGLSGETDEETAQAEELFRAAAIRQQVEEPESQSEDEPGQAPRGAGWRGVGPPLTTGSGSATRELHVSSRSTSAQISLQNLLVEGLRTVRSKKGSSN